MSALLDRTRKINRLIQNAPGYQVNFDEIAGVLRDLVGGSVFVISRRGKILGVAVTAGGTTNDVEADAIPRQVSADLNDDLMAIRDTVASAKLGGSLTIASDTAFPLPERGTAVVPVYGGGERLGTVLVVKGIGGFEDDDTLLTEYAGTVIGMEILRSKSGQAEDDARRKAAVQVALSTLSYSELEAVEHIFDELTGDEGLLVASKVADRVGITRSVIVNALRKFESAGVIESRSLGMKGTYIRVKNDKLIEELRRLRAR